MRVDVRGHGSRSIHRHLGFQFPLVVGRICCPTGRERMGSTILLTLQDPILLPPWLCFRGGFQTPRCRLNSSSPEGGAWLPLYTATVSHATPAELDPATREWVKQLLQRCVPPEPLLFVSVVAPRLRDEPLHSS
jgi:hypothetical protein